jgi:hypothetical protein
MCISTIFIYIAILFVIIKLYDSYKYYVQEEDNYITSTEDFDKYIALGRYKNSKLCGNWINMDEDERKFIRDLICHEVLNYKEKKPSFNKNLKTACKQLIITSVLSGYLLSSSIEKSFKQNSLSYFISNVI